MSGGESPRDLRALLAAELRQPEEALALDRAALCLAGEAYPDLDPQRYLSQLDALASNVRDAAGPAADAAELLRRLQHHLFDRLGFKGNTADYYNPDNSYLHRVLETRLGLPIALSVLYLEVARRLGVTCRGVGLPGHFVVAVEPLGLYMDPFHGGQLLSASDCRRLVAEMFGPAAPWREEFLEPYTKRDILFRMLTNLKHIFLGRRQYRPAAKVLEQMVLVRPEAADLYKELGWCHLRLEEPQLALDCLERYLQMEGPAADSTLVRQQVQVLRAALDRSAGTQ